MAKADDTSTISDWIWLVEALKLAVAALGSEALARERLRQWMAAGKLPWSCTSWKALDADGIAWLQQESRVGLLSGKILFQTPSTAYHEGDTQFWRANLEIDWEDNIAHEKAVEGAKAMGVKVSREHLLALLPEEPGERVEELGQTKTAERNLMAPKDWLAVVRKDYPREHNEPLVAYASRLFALMQKQQANLTKVWSFETVKRRLHDK